MTATIIKQALAILAISVLVAGCKKDDGDDGANGLIPGMGEAPGDLQGSPFKLPGQLEVPDTIRGANIFSINHCQETGKGSYVDVYIPFVNHGADVTLVIPAGLTFKSLNAEDQHGMTVQADTLFFSGGGDTCVVYARAYCVNLHKHPSSSGSKFKFGPVSNAPILLELFALLKNKNLEDLASEVQSVVWDVTNTGVLTVEHREMIAAIPEL